ncbi:EboA domain-containing protein [Nonomuraea rubra]|uniref:EboA domain-containing protein n=1 Tax=Nonomuraea rubra TaxID=46180 RepID=UPI003612327F
MIRFGYGTNGFANHRLPDALDLIAGLGYTGVALTLDHHHLDPYADGLALRVAKVADRLRTLGLGVVVETGARYLLDPRRKHAPTLLDDDRDKRVDFLRRAVAIGADLGAEAVSFWSGVRPAHVPPDLAWDRLVDGCARVLEQAGGVPLGFEPEPGMLVDTIAGWHALRRALGAPDGFGLTLDIGHCRCNEPGPVPDCVTAAGPYLVNVQIDDMRRGTHEHLEFGEGRSTSRRCCARSPPPATAAWSPSSCPATRTPPPTSPPAPSPSSARPNKRPHARTGNRPHARTIKRPHARTGRNPKEAERDATRAAARRTPRHPGRRLAGRGPGQPRHVPPLVRRRGKAHRPGPAAGRAGLDGRRGRQGPAAGGAATRPRRRRGRRPLPPRRRRRETRRAQGPPLLPVGTGAVPLLRDAIRTNDARLLAAALGPYAAHLDQAAWRQAVLKCVFMGVPLAEVDRLDERADAELAAMLAAFAEEREAAGRPMPGDAAALLGRLTSRLTGRLTIEET